MSCNFIFKGKKISKVGFFGFGSSNRALIDYLKGRFTDLSFVLRSDTKKTDTSGFSKTYFGKDARLDISEDVLFFSPSVKRDAPEFVDAQKNGTILSSDVEFFFEFKKIPVLSVTGSDGKSTTATLSSMMLSDSLGPFPASANIGTPIASILGKEEIVGTVAELSSFQLMNFRPKSKRALITNVTENHLDWHCDLDEYVRAKENVLEKAEERIFNLDCPISSKFTEKYPAYAVYSSRLPFSEMRKKYHAEHYFSDENGCILHSGEKLIEKNKLIFSEPHNVINFIAATALTCELVTYKSILKAAENFSPLRHRCEKIGTFDGITFYDSSADSTPARTKITLSSFKTPTVLILGGRSKRVSYLSLFPLPDCVKAVVITGENSDEIKKALFSQRRVITGRLPIFYAEPFSEAVFTAINLASPGDAVLLSPASTSFDSFDNYAARGLFFSDTVKKYYAEK